MLHRNEFFILQNRGLQNANYTQQNKIEYDIVMASPISENMLQVPLETLTISETPYSQGLGLIQVINRYSRCFVPKTSLIGLAASFTVYPPIMQPFQQFSSSGW